MKSVFARSQRHLRRGCIRVDGAVDFARKLAEASGQAGPFDRILGSGITGAVTLANPIPVRLIYQTALMDEAGEVTFRPDI